MVDQPSSWANLLSSFAAIFSALAWPAVALWFLCTHRIAVAELLHVLIKKLSSAKKFKVGEVEIEAFEDEIQKTVTEAGAQVDADLPRTVPANQLQAAEQVKRQVESAEIPEESALDVVRTQVYELAMKYDVVREEMLSGRARTRRMNEIAAGMRALALAALKLRTELTRSKSAGCRLAAICILQIEPRTRYFGWLTERFKVESQAFILYQASIAILEFVKKRFYVNPDETRTAIEDAISAVSSYVGGTPDQNTLDVLSEARSLVR